MAGFWYFFPEQQRDAMVAGDQLRRDVLRAAGLDGVLADVVTVPDQAIVQQRPHGVIVYPIPNTGDIPAKVDDAGRLTWRDITGGLTPPRSPATAYRLGWDPAAPPTPAELERRGPAIAGFSIRDAHGRPWNVPVLRSPASATGNLPAAFRWGEDLRPALAVDGRYEKLWQRSAPIYDRWPKGPDDLETFWTAGYTAAEKLDLLDYVLGCLAINYRGDAAVWATLDRLFPGWMQDATLTVMVDATLDLPLQRAILAAQKKTAS